MIEVDHNITPEPQAAKPILASQLLELEEKQRTRFTRDGNPERLSTACGEIDELIGGQGIERGIVVGISAEGGEGRLISLNILASILLSQLPTITSTTRAAVIDTTGSFPLALLAKILKSRITAERASPNFLTRNVDTNIGTDVLKCLDMIGISRVFDLEGLWEVLGEVRRAPDGIVRGREVPPKPPVSEIANSDEEEEDDILASPPYNQNSVPKERADSGVEIIIIDSLTHVINELFSRKEKSDAHNLLALLSQSLTALTQSCNIIAILHNNVVPSTPIAKAPPQSSLHYHPPPQQEQQPKAQKQSSTLFPSNATKPALGQIFSQFPSLHLSLSKLPKFREDAEVLYGSDEDPGVLDHGHGEKKGVEYCTVIEVLKDETPNLGVGKEGRGFGMREGEWCAVDVRGDGVGFESAFEVKGGMRRVALERKEKEKVHGVGRGEFGGGVGTVSSVAKVWGFGGRRV